MNRWIFAILVAMLAFCGRDGVRAQTPAPSPQPSPEAVLKAQLADRDKTIDRLQKLLNLYVANVSTCEQRLALAQVEIEDTTAKQAPAQH